MASANANDTLT